MMASLSGTLATMGPGVPYAIAAKFAYPDRPVIALVGDGAMQMNGINELITVAKYWQRWTDPRLVVLVLNNQRPEPGHLGAARDGGRSEVPGARRRSPTSRYARYAELLGLRGHPRRRPATRSARPGTRRSPPTGRSCSRRSTDPEVPPLPPHITLEQAKNFAAGAGQRRPERGAG